MSTHLSTIKKLPVFQDFSDQTLKEFSHLCAMRNFGEGEMIYLRGRQQGKVFLLISGKVKLYQSALGKKVVIQVFKPGDFFGNIPLTHTYPLREESSAQASQESTVCVISKQDFTTILNRSPELAMTLLTVLRNRLHQAESKIKDLAISSAQIRLINELIRYATHHGQKINGFYKIEEKLTHQLLSEMIGVTRETVTKTLIELKKLGFIKYGPGRSIILNRDKIIKNCILCLRPEV
ncbi:MAG: Crp/Fnr family transcriptional regulator [Patescibacteria group bacterium]|nr:Crp/Fnr family transcriptional regulator [Patescibacteria group bacterium]